MPNVNGPRWTQDEIDDLRDGYMRRQPPPVIAAALNKTPQAVRGKAHRLGISPPRRINKLWPDTRMALTRIDALTDVELAYIAGIYDGEGHIRHKTGPRDPRGRWILQVGNTSRPLVDWLADRIGGSVYTVKPKPHRQQFYLWHLMREALVIRLLSRCRPYLVIKQDRAGEILAMADPNLPAHHYASVSKRRHLRS